jgi:hypothetical protein
MAYGYNTFTGAITGKVNLYDCNNAEFRSTINSTPNYPQRLIDCLFNTGTVTMAGVTPVAISVNGTSYKQLKARTPTLTDVTYIHVDGGVMIGAVTEILVGGGDGTNPVWTTATGTGAPVRATQPILDTPTIGTATFTSLKHTNIQILGAQVATLGLNAKTDANKITDIIAALRSHGIIGPNAV